MFFDSANVFILNNPCGGVKSTRKCINHQSYNKGENSTEISQNSLTQIQIPWNSMNYFENAGSLL